MPSRRALGGRHRALAGRRTGEALARAMASARRALGRSASHLATTAAATLLVATVSLTAATILLQATNRAERQANDAKEVALRQAKDNADDARHQEALALRQKWQAEDNAQEAKHQQEIAEEQKRRRRSKRPSLAVNEFLQKDLLGQADIGQQMVGRLEQRDPDVKVRTLLDRASRSIEGKFTKQPLTEAAIRSTIGNSYRAMGR